MKTLIAIFIAATALVYTVGDSFIEPAAKKGGPGMMRSRGPAAVAVELTELRTGQLVDQAVFAGSLTAKSYFVVAPKISGRLKELKVDIGDEIINGEIIATLDDEEQAIALRQAQADLDIAAANLNESTGLLEIAERELERVKTMRKQQISSEVEMENAQANYKTRLARRQVNKALLNQKQAALEAAKLRLSYTKISIPWSGGSRKRFVAERFQQEGAMLAANAPLVSMIDIATLTAEVDLVEKDYFKVKPGLLAEVEAEAIPNRIFPATVTRVSPLLDKLSRQARIELELENQDYELKPGMFVKVRLIYAVHSNTIIAPNSALARRQDQEGVFLVDEGTSLAKFIQVQKGFTEGENFEILSPPISGKVVTLGHHLLEDGSAVIIAGASAPTSTQEKQKSNKGKGKGKDSAQSKSGAK